MTALAELLIAHGKVVTGSDTAEEFFTDAVLKQLHVPVRIFDPATITKDIDLVIRSSAYGDDHPEVAAAHVLGIPVCLYIDAVAELFNATRGILVTGTHGKTTTTAMIGQVLESAGMDPTVLVGEKVLAWGKNARVGHGEWMVAEGDEYQEKFLKMKPEVLVVTSIEYDHPDFFRTPELYKEAFRVLVRSMPASGLLVAEEGLRSILITDIPCRVVWYGIEGEKEGRHWELDAEAAIRVAEYLGIPRERAAETLQHYAGTARRTEFYTAPDADTVVINDYAHHPTEIRTTLAYLRARYPDRYMVAVFHPHTFSRTAALLRGFAHAFTHADEVVLLPIYASAREHREDFSATLFDELLHALMQNKERVHAVSDIEGAVIYCKGVLAGVQKRLIVTLGAGDVWRVAEALTSHDAGRNTTGA